MIRVAVFVSGRGSNLEAILNSPKLKKLVIVKAVISDNAECPAFEIAKKNSIDTYNVGKQENFIHYSDLAEFLKSLDIGLIVLAGFLKMFPETVIKNFNNRIINIHPALLPSFGGKGMYGMNVHKAVYNSGAKVSGATVHFIDEAYDEGKIIAQKKVDISDVKFPEQIAERVLKIEHELLPFVIEKFARNQITVEKNRIILLR